MDQAAVPAGFNYQPIPAAVGGYYSQSKQPPSNGTTFTAGQWIQLPIVTGRIGQFYDPQRCYFMFQVTMAGANALMLERVGAHAFFESVELWLNGQPLEQIQQYNCLMQLIRDQYYGLGRADVCASVEGCATEDGVGYSVSTFVATFPQSALVKKGITNLGAGAQTTGETGFVSQMAATTNNAAIGVVAPGAAIGTPAGAMNQIVPSGGTSVGRWFAVPILSGLLGTLAAKAFPALVFAPGSLFWQIKLAQPAAPGTRVTLTQTNATTAGIFIPYAAGDAWTINSFNFVSGAVTLQSGVAATILSAAASGQLDLNTKSFTNVSASLAAASSAANIIVPLRKLSLNSIFVVFRDPNRESASGTTQIAVNPVSASNYGGFLGRIAPTGCLLETFTAQWRFGNELIREYPYQQHVEFYVEVLRNLHEWMDKELNFTAALQPLRFAQPRVNADPTQMLRGSTSAAVFSPIGGFYGAYLDGTSAGSPALPNATTILFTCDKPSQIVQNCGFFLALDLDVFSGSSSTSRSGRNTTGDQITLNLTNGGSATDGMFGQRSMRVDFFGMHDLRVNIQAGGIAVPVS